MRKLALLVAAFAVACAPATEGVTVPPTAGAPAPAMPEIIGDYAVTLSDGDLDRAAPQAMRNATVGNWVLAFHAGNHFIVTHNGAQVAEGPYQVSGNQIMFSTGETGRYACNVPATYTWRVQDGQLTFAPVGNDPCRGRVLAITSRPFTRRP